MYTKYRTNVLECLRTAIRPPRIVGSIFLLDKAKWLITHGFIFFLVITRIGAIIRYNHKGGRMKYVTIDTKVKKCSLGDKDKMFKYEATTLLYIKEEGQSSRSCTMVTSYGPTKTKALSGLMDNVLVEVHKNLKEAA